MSSKPYSQFKVSELKDVLRKRGLPFNGTKSELIARLQEDDADKNDDTVASNDTPVDPTEVTESKEETKAEEPAETNTETVEPETETVTVTETVETDGDSGDKDVTISEETVEEKVEEPVLSDEEQLARFIADIETQIARSKRFGGDVSELEARIKRVNKFGIAAVRASMTAPAISKPIKKHNRSRGRRAASKAA